MSPTPRSADPPMRGRLAAVEPPAADDFAQAALVAQVVAFAFGLRPQDVAGAPRARAEVSRARHVAIYLAHVALGWPLQRAAIAFGRDRTTAGYACAKIEDARDDARFDARLAELEAWLRAAPTPARAPETGLGTGA